MQCLVCSHTSTDGYLGVLYAQARNPDSGRRHPNGSAPTPLIHGDSTVSAAALMLAAQVVRQLLLQYSGLPDLLIWVLAAGALVKGLPNPLVCYTSPSVAATTSCLHDVVHHSFTVTARSA